MPGWGYEPSERELDVFSRRRASRLQRYEDDETENDNLYAQIRELKEQLRISNERYDKLVERLPTPGAKEER